MPFLARQHSNYLLLFNLAETSRLLQKKQLSGPVSGLDNCFKEAVALFIKFRPIGADRRRMSTYVLPLHGGCVVALPNGRGPAAFEHKLCQRLAYAWCGFFFL